jgi:hypothetical protein
MIFYKLHRPDSENQPDPYYLRMNLKAYRALFEDKPLAVSPAGGENLIFNGTPLVEVTIGQGSVSVNILDGTPSASSPPSDTLTPVAGQLPSASKPVTPNILPTPDQIFSVPELHRLVGKHLYNAPRFCLATARSNEVCISLIARSTSASVRRNKLIQPLFGRI